MVILEQLTPEQSRQCHAEEADYVKDDVMVGKVDKDVPVQIGQLGPP